MNQDLQNFELELYQEHLEEASFLYEQRRTLLSDPTISWQDLETFEQRREAHLDALLAGGEVALGVCGSCTLSGDPGEINAAVTLFCRWAEVFALHDLLINLDWQDDELVPAVLDALALEISTAQLGALLGLAENLPPMIPMLAQLLARVRHHHPPQLLESLQDFPQCKAVLISALQRMPTQATQSWLVSQINQGELAIRQAALVALLALGDRQLADPYLKTGVIEKWNLMPLGLAGDSQVVTQLLENARTRGLPGLDALLALGLLGDLRAVPVLIDYLTIDKAAAFSALALNLVTGARLFEEVFVAEEFEEDDLLEEELVKVKSGEPLTHENGNPYGETLTRPCQDRNTWLTWWTQHSEKFTPQLRYRLGKAYEPLVLLENLAAPEWPAHLRWLVVSELQLRYRINLPIELEWPVARQRELIEWQRQQLLSGEVTWEAGRWYFAGE